MESKPTQAACPNSDLPELLGLLSKRHMLPLIATLAEGPQGFTTLQASIGVNTATLSRRLDELEAASLVFRTDCPRDSRCHYYSLTKKGQKISQLLQQFC